jgi:hypothetical protein
MSPYINHPLPSKAWHHDMQGSPGGHQVSSSKRDAGKYGCIDMSFCSWVIVMGLHHLGSCMELMTHLPAIVTIIIALPLDQILEAIIPHLAV